VHNELYAQLWMNVHDTENISVGLFKPDDLSSDESLLIRNGLFIFLGMTLERASTVLIGPSFTQFGGRILKLPSIILGDERGFSSFLTLLDEVDDDVTSVISSSSSEFKAQALLKKLHCSLKRWSLDLWRTLSPLFTQMLSGQLDVEVVRFLRQWSNLLSKISISRKDLLADHYSEYHYSEWLSFAETSVQRSGSLAYRRLISEVRFALRQVLHSFTMKDFVPKHGPGAVSIPRVRTKLQKYLHFGYDSRVDYLLRKEFGESVNDYSPFPLKDGDRTSRVIFVPKTWKKLRGISAEPVGLQFFQQGVLGALSDSISNSDVGRIVDMSDQSVSRRLAQRGSRDGSLCTIDLSAASDSVTLQLVKDIFGNTNLCRWLLATRSTHTLVNDERLEIYKFAPMGSACCFPVECLIFAGVVLATAARHARGRPLHYGNYRVYGDDIICPTSISCEVIESLTLLGFSVNTDKTFLDGDFRESCGMDAWKGSDVTPLKLKDFSFDFDGSVPCSYDHHSRIISYLNTLYHSGYKALRSFLLEKFLKCYVVANGQRIKVGKTLVFGDGCRGSIASVQPDNFHLTKVPLKGLQRGGLSYMGWKPRRQAVRPEDEVLWHQILYLEHLFTLKGRDCLEPVVEDIWKFKARTDDESALAIPDEPQMVPSGARFDPWVPDEWRGSTVSR